MARSLTEEPASAAAVAGHALLPGLAGVRRVGYLLSNLVLVISATLLIPLGVAVGYGEARAARSFFYTIVIAVTAGVAGHFLARTDLSGMTRREGFAVVALAWIMISLVGALPYMFAGTLPGFVDALFESVSGFTTTGSSVIADVEAVPRGVLFWRDLTHWLGGMGVIVLYIALFPLLGVGAIQVYRAEIPGPEKDRVTPRIRQTAMVLWIIYLTFSVVLTGLLLLGGMDWFDSLCHMFAIMGTGGFSTRNASIAAFDSAYIDWVCTAFMFLAACNFALYYFVGIGRPRRMLGNPELRFFAGGMTAFTIVIAVVVWQATATTFGTSLRQAAFEVVTTASTTGFMAADYELWPVFCQVLILVLMFAGACAGSTGGGMKQIRVLILIKHMRRELARVIHPRAVSPIRLGRDVVPPDLRSSVLGFVALYGAVFLVAAAGLAASGLDFTTAASSAATTLGNVGPGLGDVGPTETFAPLSAPAKLICQFCMLAGRLELYTLLLLFTPAFWRR